MLSDERLDRLIAVLEKLAERPPAPVHVHINGMSMQDVADDGMLNKRKPSAADRETDGWNGVGAPRPYVS